MTEQSKREVWVIEHRGEPVGVGLHVSNTVEPPFEQVRYVPAAAQQEERGKVEFPHIAAAAALVRSFDELGKVSPNDVNRIAQALSDAEARGRSGADGGWVSVEERLPEPLNRVMVCIPQVSSPPYVQEGQWLTTHWEICNFGWAPRSAVSHWREKPAPPSSKAEE